MKPEAQRIAIAEACGWERIPDHYFVGGDAWRKPNLDVVGEGCIPDYLADLNAMHEAEKVLDAQFGTYSHELYVAVKRDWPGLDSPCRLIAPHHATAAQRAEAFLRTICKWEDDK